VSYIQLPRPVIEFAICIACATSLGVYVACRSRMARGPEWEGRVVRKWTRCADAGVAYMIDVNNVRSERPREVASDIWQAARLGDHVVMEREAVHARISTRIDDSHPVP
jgi:hypothetical protein